MRAFGVAPLLPDPADQPQRIVTDTIAPQGLRDQLDALADHDLELWRSDLTRTTDNVDGLLRRLGVADAEAASFLRRAATYTSSASIAAQTSSAKSWK